MPSKTIKGQISEENKEALSMMNGVEVISIHYEGVVGVKGELVIRDGLIIDRLNTNKKIDILWDEYFSAEVGYDYSEVIKEFENNL